MMVGDCLKAFPGFQTVYGGCIIVDSLFLDPGWPGIEALQLRQYDLPVCKGEE